MLIASLMINSLMKDGIRLEKTMKINFLIKILFDVILKSHLIIFIHSVSLLS